MSGHSVDIASSPSSDPGTFSQVPQGLPPVLDEMGTNSWSLDVPAYTVNAQVDAKAFPLGLHPSIQPILLQVIHERAGALHPEIPFAGIHKECFSFPVVHLSPSKDSPSRTTFTGSTSSSLQGCKGVRSVISLTPNDDSNRTTVDGRIRDLPQEPVLMNVSLDYRHPYTRVHTTPSNFSESPTSPVISCGKIRASRERFHQFQRTGRDLAAAFSHSPLRPGEKPGGPQGRYSCGICKRDYAQPQGLTRHQREKHKARLCTYCRGFAWARPYLFRNHLVKLHPEIDPNLAIKEATRSRRSATIRRRYQPPQPFPIPTTEHDGWDRTESQAFSESNRLTLSQLEVAKLTPFFQPDTLSLVYDPQIEPTKTAIKEVPKSEDVHPLELLNASDDRATSPPMEEPAQPATTLGAFARTVQFWSQDMVQAVSAVKFTAADGPSTLETAPLPAPTPSVSGNGDSPAIVSPLVEPSGHTYSCYSPPALAMLRSARAPAPSFPIGHSWADIFPLGDWA